MSSEPQIITFRHFITEVLRAFFIKFIPLFLELDKIFKTYQGPLMEKWLSFKERSYKANFLREFQFPHNSPISPLIESQRNWSD